MTMELPNRRMFGKRGRSLLMRLNSDWRSHIRIGFMVVINNICKIFQLKPFADIWLLLVQRCCPVSRTCWVFDCQQPLWLLQNEANLFKWVQWVCLEAQPRESSVLFHFLSAACRASLWGQAEWEAAFGTGGCQWHLATRLPLPQTLFLYYEGIISRTDPPCVFFLNERKTKKDWHESLSRTELRRKEENINSTDLIYWWISNLCQQTALISLNYDYIFYIYTTYYIIFYSNNLKWKM